ncbi:DUF4352 domain-containing protein [Clostridium sardiniense]|uniref:DUF4352 domain-containing protein n=1 Tax=Clostridium sardiniense TaxID=29369 RepID=UPI001A9C707E|nr:DUF4352 domain-containing protein [Clostridium sardiniense]MBM7835253.1 putative membrane protein [Clostridium sardiniense]
MSKEKKSIFKRWWFWLIVVIIIIGAVQAGSNKPTKVDGSSNTASNSSDNSKKEKSNETQTFKVGDTIQTKDFKIKVNKITTSNGSEFVKPQKGNEFVKVDVTVENTSKEEQAVSSVMMFKVVDKDGRSCNQAITENQKGQLDGKVAPGRKITGEYIVEAPKGEKGLELQFDSSLLSSGQVIVKLN